MSVKTRLRKRRRAAVYILAAVALTASCSGRSGVEDAEAEIKDNFRGAAEIVAAAEIIADYEDSVFEFKVKYTGAADMGTVEILAPEQIAGIKARVDFPECYLEYDGASIEAGPLTGDGLSPVQTLPVLLGQWTDGYAETAGFEKLGDAEAFVMETRITDAASQKTWFDAETLLPMRAEIYNGGRMVVVCEVESIQIRAGGGAAGVVR